MRQVLHHHLQQVVHLARKGVAGHHFVPAVHAFGEGLHGVGVMAGQLHAHEGLQSQADSLGVDAGGVTGQHAVLFQALHAAQAGRGRKFHALGQVGVAQPAFALEFGQDGQVGAIEL